MRHLLNSITLLFVLFLPYISYAEKECKQDLSLPNKFEKKDSQKKVFLFKDMKIVAVSRCTEVETEEITNLFFAFPKRVELKKNLFFTEVHKSNEALNRIYFYFQNPRLYQISITAAFTNQQELKKLEEYLNSDFLLIFK